MITDLPFYAYATFFVALVFVLVQFYRASNKNYVPILIIVSWGILHSILAISGFYKNTMTIPPRLMILVFPLMIIIISTIFSSKMKAWLATLDLKKLTFLHSVRIPVEMVLFWLFTANYIPEIMTFEGHNFDILAGITAPIVALVAFRNGKINAKILWVWNIISIVLLTNILVHAVLSAPMVLQQFAFDQPNRAVFYFPFILLPGIIVPVVLISNIAAFVILKRKQSER